MDDIHDFINQFGERVDEVEDVLTDNRIWVQRTKDVGIVTADDALNMGFRYSPHNSGVASNKIVFCKISQWSDAEGIGH